MNLRFVKNTRQLTLGLVVACWMGLFANDVSAKVRDTGNAGDSYALDFVRHALKGLALLERGDGDIVSEESIREMYVYANEKIVRSEDRVFVYDEVLKKEVETDVKNYKDANGQVRFVVSRKRWPFALDGKTPKSPEEKMSLALHELGAPLGIEINTHGMSARFRNFLDVVKSTQPVLLREIPAQGRKGMSEEEMKKSCASLQKTYEQVYFYVYCDIEAHDWKEVNLTPVYRYVTRIAGYRFYRSYVLDSYDSEASTWTVFQWRSLDLGSDYMNYYLFGSSVLVYAQEPYSIATTVSRSVYGIKVFGLGLLRDLPFRLLKRSDRLLVTGGKTFGAMFDSDIDARAACVDAVLGSEKSKDAWKYERAQCRSVEMKVADGDSKYRYEIRTQNPYLLVK